MIPASAVVAFPNALRCAVWTALPHSHLPRSCDGKAEDYRGREQEGRGSCRHSRKDNNRENLLGASETDRERRRSLSWAGIRQEKPV